MHGKTPGSQDSPRDFGVRRWEIGIVLRAEVPRYIRTAGSQTPSSFFGMQTFRLSGAVVPSDRSGPNRL